MNTERLAKGSPYEELVCLSENQSTQVTEYDVAPSRVGRSDGMARQQVSSIAMLLPSLLCARESTV